MLNTTRQRFREVTVRPTIEPGEPHRWVTLMVCHHYPSFRGDEFNNAGESDDF